MTRPRIALLDPSENENTRRNFRRELDADLAEFAVRDGVPEGFAFDGAVIPGSRASVYWDEPWIDLLVEWVGTAVERDMPVLGVCFGHQVLAAALGGEVEDMGSYEIGYRDVEVGDDPLFADVESPATVFTTHSDTVTELPPEAEQIAANDYGVHGFRVGNAVGVQFHPEYDPATAREVTRGKDLPDERIDRVLDGISEANYAAACEAKTLFSNFTESVRELRDGGESAARAGEAVGD